MLPKPEGCNLCPLRDKGLGFVPDTIAPNAEYIYFGEAPGKDEVAQGKPFVGRAGFVLKNWLTKAVPILQIALEKGHITLANTLRCLPPELHGRAYPRGEEKEAAEACCRQYDNWGNAHTIILFGESPQRHFFGTELAAEDISDRTLGHEVKGVTGRTGRIYEKEGKKWIFAPHPAFILRQPSMVEHGQQALRIAAQTETVVEVEYFDWENAVNAV